MKKGLTDNQQIGIIILIVNLILYLLGVFITLHPNPVDWDIIKTVDGRFLISICQVFIALMIIVIYKSLKS